MKNDAEITNVFRANACHKQHEIKQKVDQTRVKKLDNAVQTI